MKLKYYMRGLGLGIIVTAIIMSFIKQPEKLTDTQIKLRALELGMVEKSVLADFQESNSQSTEHKTQESENENSEIEKEAQESENENSEIEKEVQEPENTNSEVGKDIQNPENDSQHSADEKTSLEDVLRSEGEGAIGNNIEVEQRPAIQENLEVTEEEVFPIDESQVDESLQDNSETVDNLHEMVDSEQVEKYVVITVEGGNGSEVVSRRLYEAGLVDSAIGYNKYLVDNGYSRILKVGNHEIPVGATEEEMAKILCGMR